MVFLNYLLSRSPLRLLQKADPVYKKFVYSSLNWLVFSVKNGDDFTPQPVTVRQNIIITR
jgi:hypothetical protein